MLNPTDQIVQHIQLGRYFRAADHGRSVDEEARDILRQSVGRASTPTNLGEAIHRRFAALGGVDLALPDAQGAAVDPPHRPGPPPNGKPPRPVSNAGV